jgi:hypothetical protein
MTTATQPLTKASRAARISAQPCAPRRASRASPSAWRRCTSWTTTSPAPARHLGRRPPGRRPRAGRAPHPARLVIPAPSTGTAAFASDLPPRGLTDLIAEVPVPVFFIYATPGQGGETLTPVYYEAASEPKELWAAEGGHTGAIDVEPPEYERRVIAFFDRALLEGTRRRRPPTTPRPFRPERRRS